MRGKIQEIFDDWARTELREDSERAERVRELCKLLPKAGPDCLNPAELRRYVQGEEEITARYKDHVPACEDYCKPATNILSESA